MPDGHRILNNLFNNIDFFIRLILINKKKLTWLTINYLLNK